ncbi:hypothetical protein MCOR02_002764 [Pyricularia oryzae]|nr:hypothetical protein MCOR02_002764 [Pyricularia oryzae]
MMRPFATPAGTPPAKPFSASWPLVEDAGGAGEASATYEVRVLSRGLRSVTTRVGTDTIGQE